MAEKPRDCRARVEAIRALGPETVEVDLRMVDPPGLAFAAGQWVSVPVGPKTVRAYSIASTPLSSRLVTLAADVAPGGPGSRWFRALASGMAVSFKAPFGGFVFNRADPRRPLFVAEAIGIVPVRSILTALYETGHGRPTTLVYGAPDPASLPYHAELCSLARRYPGFAYHALVERAPPAWPGDRGDLAEAVERLAPAVAGLITYVAGGAALIERVRRVLVARGLERRAVKWEKFW